MDNADENIKKCLICGADISGRSNRIFCSIECKNAFHNERRSIVRNYKNRVITSLNSNYRILDKLLNDDVKSISLCDIEPLGFRPTMVTGYQRAETNASEYLCFDIKYRMSDSKVYKIEKIKKY